MLNAVDDVDEGNRSLKKKKKYRKNNCFKAFVKGKMCVDQVGGKER